MANNFNPIQPIPFQSTVSDGLASYGRAKTYMGTLFGSSLLTIFLIVGIYMVNQARKNKNNYKPVQARVISIRPDIKRYYAIISYTVLDKTYENNIYFRYYKSIGSLVTIYYDVNNPNMIEEKSPQFNMMIGFGIIICVLLSCGFMFYNAYIVKKSDFAAQSAAFTSSPSYNSPSLLSLRL
jgi:hypothetical protein